MTTQKVSATVTLLAGGDVGPLVEHPEEFVNEVLPVLRQADIRLVQCERTYSKRGLPPHFGIGGVGGTQGDHSRVDPSKALIYERAGIDVASLASNHAMDWGPEAMADTVELFHSMGIQVVGAGKNIEEARQPAIIERNGVTVAILGYCSVIRDGQAAAPDKPGLAPMRARTYYEPNDFQPGMPPNIISVPYEEDLTALREESRKAKAQADVVILFIHWGLIYISKTLATYQPQVAHAAIDAGADLIIGHHAHILKAVEVYKGKVCFYSIGNFMTTGAIKSGPPCLKNMYWYETDPEAPLYRFPVDSRKTMLVKALLSKKGVEKVSFLPTFINKSAHPEVLNREDPKFDMVLRYTEWVSDQFAHSFKVEGDEVIVET